MEVDVGPELSLHRPTGQVKVVMVIIWTDFIPFIQNR
jgi:hypothetical protein